jgi:hypothetical protein
LSIGDELGIEPGLGREVLQVADGLPVLDMLASKLAKWSSCAGEDGGEALDQLSCS